MAIYLKDKNLWQSMTPGFGGIFPAMGCREFCEKNDERNGRRYPRYFSVKYERATITREVEQGIDWMFVVDTTGPIWPHGCNGCGGVLKKEDTGWFARSHNDSWGIWVGPFKTREEAVKSYIPTLYDALEVWKNEQAKKEEDEAEARRTAYEAKQHLIDMGPWMLKTLRTLVARHRSEDAPMLYSVEGEHEEWRCRLCGEIDFGLNTFANGEKEHKPWCPVVEINEIVKEGETIVLPEGNVIN